MRLPRGFTYLSMVCAFCLAAPRLALAERLAAPIVKFTPATKQEATNAIDQSKHWAAEIGSKMRIEFSTIETEHFLVFTDWDPREFDFLKTNVEGAYAAVARQLEMPVNQNVFIGKLPIMMFAKRADFERFATEVDHLDAKRLAGYFGGRSDGFGHMAMWKPDLALTKGDLHAAEREWAHVLVHEFTHAFVSRYRTNVFVPRWLGEGMAEVVASDRFPHQGIHAYVKRMSANGKGIKDIFEDKDITTFKATDYPFAQTVVETLIAGDPRAFLHYFNDIKDGMDPDEALQKNYHTDRHGLEQAWKKYVSQMRGD